MLAQSLHTNNFCTDLLYYVRAPWEPERDWLRLRVAGGAALERHQGQLRARRM